MRFVSHTVSRVTAKITSRARVILASAMFAFATLGGVVALPTSPALASGCSAGTWGGIHGWGDCRGMGAQRWQLQLSCTWGASTSSGVITGDGHVDIQCPWGSARYASILYL